MLSLILEIHGICLTDRVLIQPWQTTFLDMRNKLVFKCLRYSVAFFFFLLLFLCARFTDATSHLICIRLATSLAGSDCSCRSVWSHCILDSPQFVCFLCQLATATNLQTDSCSAVIISQLRASYYTCLSLFVSNQALSTQQKEREGNQRIWSSDNTFALEERERSALFGSLALSALT